MKFVPCEFGGFVVRAVRQSPYSSIEAAKKAIKKVGQGYIKQLGVSKPVWSNVL